HREAAAKSGMLFPDKNGLRLLAMPKIKQEIERICKRDPPIGEISDGLRRIAFGSICDAVRLGMAEPGTLKIEELDLFSVSEIKFQIGKGVEIKFFDRIKALEKLSALETNSNDENSSAPFYNAIMKGAESLEGSWGDVS
ncbi:MAG: terminase small subunit, partial [Oscillospiraceae bacterium]